MDVLDCMFLFEIKLEEVKTFESKQFVIRSEFSDIFSIELKDPEETVTIVSKRRQISKSKTVVKNAKEASNRQRMKPPDEPSQSILFPSNVDLLMSRMLRFPLELSLWSKEDPEERISSTQIPWNPAFVEFLARLYKGEDAPPAVVTDLHNFFDEYTSRWVASIQLNIKLSYIKERISSRVQARSSDKTNKATSTGKHSKLACRPVSNTKKKSVPAIAVETGTIKTIYSGGKTKKRNPRKRRAKNNENDKNIIQNTVQIETQKAHKDLTKKMSISNSKALTSNNRIRKGLVTLVKSQTNMKLEKGINLLTSKSCSSIKQLNTLHYIFGDERGPPGNRIYTVGNFTVQSPPASASNRSSQVSVPARQKKVSLPTSNRSTSSPPHSPKATSESSLDLNYKIQLCTDECGSKRTRPSLSEFAVDLPREASHLITVIKCKDESCGIKRDREFLDPGDDRILIDLGSRGKPCCVSETPNVERQVVGGMAASFMLGADPCYCACECIFGFGDKTTYCKICGGYETAGTDIAGKLPGLEPIPCPEYHKLMDKNKAKTGSTSGSESKKKHGRGDFEDPKKGKKKKKDDRFKFNYGYKAPQIGHSQCGMPCAGTLTNVPKSMGWLWTADNVPGMKFRPQWKPGAVSKFVLRLLRMAKNPGEVAKKRRKDTGKKKRPLKRPLLVVHKKDGEYSVTMETMKSYAKPRALNQQPYEDKPVITYTIGRTEEENRERRKKKERAQRRLEREQREFIQSAFRDICQEICLKTYQQALGILPDAEDPKCSCYPALPGPDRTDLNRSCSCSEDSASLASDTDSDEWILEFTPPNAHFDPTYKGKKIIKMDHETQYSYLDYRVKLLDRFGNQVPRFFKGIDGKQLCSDLGGFWSADHQWQEINVDGIIGADGRWAPLTFTGPNGEQVDIDTTGKFQAMDGSWLVVGVDGYIDGHCKWRSYPRPRTVPIKKQRGVSPKKVDKKNEKKAPSPELSEPAWSCFGDASPKQLGEMGIVGHGADKKLLYKTLKQLQARGEKDIKFPQVSQVPRFPGRRGRTATPSRYDSRTYFDNRTKCKHPVPSDKGIVMDSHGHKTYYKWRNWKNTRPKERLRDLDSQGRSLSTFHEPCLHSFIDAETMKQQQRERLLKLAGVDFDQDQEAVPNRPRRGAARRSTGSRHAGDLARSVINRQISTRNNSTIRPTTSVRLKV